MMENTNDPVRNGQEELATLGKMQKDAGKCGNKEEDT